MENDNMLICLVLLVPLFLLCALSFYLNIFRDFLDERSYIKREMKRAGSEREYRYWKRMLKRCYRSLLPNVFKKY